MKKVLIWILCISVSVLALWEQSFAETLSFTSKNGRTFCEANKYDGSYKECTREQISKNDLVKANTYGPRVIETALEWICVENGIEVNSDLCREEIDALKNLVYPSTKVSTGMSFTPISLEDISSDRIPPPKILSGTSVSTGKISTGVTLSSESTITTSIKKDISGFKKDISSASKDGLLFLNNFPKDQLVFIGVGVLQYLLEE